MNEEIEVWMDLIGFDIKYQVSSFGRLKLDDEEIQEHVLSNGYCYFKLKQNGKVLWKSVHRIIYSIFYEIKLPSNSHIHHKDENTTNNRLYNLELLNRSDHSKYHARNRDISKEKNPNFGKNHTGTNSPWFGKHHSKDTKKIISERMSGEKNPNFGKHWSNEIKLQISNKLKCKPKKLTLEDVQQIKQLLKEECIKQTEISKIFNVDPSIISAIKLNKIWKEV